MCWGHLVLGTRLFLRNNFRARHKRTDRQTDRQTDREGYCYVFSVREKRGSSLYAISLCPIRTSIRTDWKRDKESDKRDFWLVSLFSDAQWHSTWRPHYYLHENQTPYRFFVRLFIVFLFSPLLFI